jgi:hypothetical protein
MAPVNLRRGHVCRVNPFQRFYSGISAQPGVTGGAFYCGAPLGLHDAQAPNGEARASDLLDSVPCTAANDISQVLLRPLREQQDSLLIQAMEDVGWGNWHSHTCLRCSFSLLKSCIFFVFQNQAYGLLLRALVCIDNLTRLCNTSQVLRCSDRTEEEEPHGRHSDAVRLEA